jgi:hypothetical protein
VRYEIEQSWDRKNGLIGIYVPNMKDQYQRTEPQGNDPFVAMGWKNFKTYDRVKDNGYQNIGEG